MPDPAASGLPTLAYCYEPGSFATLALRAAAQGCCELLWVVDASRPDVQEVAPLLQRFGAVLDTSGRTTDEIVAAIGSARPSGILALADDALRSTAALASRLGLPFHSEATALALTDKHVQRDALAAAGLPTPASRVVPGGADPTSLATLLDEVLAEVGLPAVVKPRVGEGSRDTIRVATPGELRDGVARALASSARDLVVEAYLADAGGPVAGEGFAGYVSVESVVSDGIVSHLAVNGRTPPAPPFRETGFFIPAALDATTQAAVLDVAAAAARALGVTVGCLHTEIKLTPAGPVVIEVNGRVGGGVPELLAATSDVALLTLAMRLALGERIVLDGPLHARCVAFLLYVQAPAALRVVTSVEGVDELRTLEGVDEVVLRRGAGEQIDWREGNHGHVLSVFGTVADHDALRRTLAAVAATVRIVGS